MTPRPALIIKSVPNVIILLHGFNSGPGKKAEQISEFIYQNQLTDKFKLIAPALDQSPRNSIREINRLIRGNKGRKVFLVGTSLGGFYANYFRAKFKEEFLTVHAINPSWRPSKTLQKYTNTELTNYKTQEKWFFNEKYIEDLIEFELFIDSNLASYSSNKYNIHLSRSDELLSFEDMMTFLKLNSIQFNKFEYDSDHRFDKIIDIMELIIRDEKQ